MYTLHREQPVHTSIKRAGVFVKNPGNLNVINPDNLDFRIVSEVPEEKYDGLLIEHTIRIPLLGFQRGVTEIKHVHPSYAFVDEQRVGPYKLWYHYHELVETGDGIRVADTVTYQVPFGIIGKMAHRLFIGKMLERIFNYRAKKFAELLDHGV